MKIIVCETYEDMARKGAELIKQQMIEKPDSILGLATGSTPVGTYRCLVDMYKKGEIDFSPITTFNLDEYYPISNNDPQSYHYFMNDNLFKHVNINPDRIHIPNGEALDPEAECLRYEQELAEKGPVDLQILGIGRNGHIGFNEPEMQLHTRTHMTPLTDDTIDANSRFFEPGQDIPDHALTMGISTILSSKKIILMASGQSKHQAVSELLSDKITTNNPSTLLKVHPDVTLICDRAAFSEMTIGIDMGGMSIKIGVVDNYEIIDRENISIMPEYKAEDIVDEMAKVCRKFMEKYPIYSVGIGAPGFLKKGKITAVNLPFTAFPLAKELENKLNIPVALDNDANCAALGETVAGAAQGKSNLLLLTIGTGIGSGIIINGKIHSGIGCAGEAGHMSIQIDGLPCPCGRKGCWEQYASVSALIRQTKEAAAQHPDSILAGLAKETVNGKTVFEALDQGCPVAQEVFDQYIDYLANGIQSLSHILDPQLILLAGGISNEKERLVKPLVARLSNCAPIRIATLKNDAGIIGAASLHESLVK